MTEEKWNSLTELQKEEYISEYNTIREKDEELKRLRNRVRWDVCFRASDVGEGRNVVRWNREMIQLKNSECTLLSEW